MGVTDAQGGKVEWLEMKASDYQVCWYTGWVGVMLELLATLDGTPGGLPKILGCVLQ